MSYAGNLSQLNYSKHPACSHKAGTRKYYKKWVSKSRRQLGKKLLLDND